MSEKKIRYKHLVLEGSAYEAGKQLGEFLKEDKGLIAFMTSPFMGGEKLSDAAFEKVKRLYDEFCPGANEEIQGFADAVGKSYRDVVYYFAYLHMVKGNCSQIAVTPQYSADAHCYLGRNYDFGWNDSPVFIETRIDGQYKQLGFACQLFGRFDGMNEHGLCIATSAGAINPPYTEEGFVFPVVVRAVLDQCKTVEEALALFEKMPFADYRNFCIVDRQGNAALIEAAASVHSVQKGGECRIATNHYESELLRDKGFYKPMHSVVRYETLQSFVKERQGNISADDIKAVLGGMMPEGVCCNHYEDGMGTMWSMVFDATDTKAYVCFGSPNTKEFVEMKMGQDKGCYEYENVLVSEKAPKGFWEKV